ncbi:MAG TPA: hypothetical protein VFP52_13150, partial [Myxococcales bacterium]|nr:hypothetical protein [Myxococcales bacterium]
MRRSVPMLAALAVLAAAPAFAKVTRITITGRQPTAGTASIPYEVIFGLADGELDPRHPLNAIIQDLQLAPRNGRGNVEYTATFQIIKPVDMSQSSHLMFHDVANRGRRAGFGPEKADGDVDLSSGWQGDNSGTTAQDGANALGKTNEWVRVPVAVNTDGSPVTGTVLGRIVNRSGPASQAILVQSSPLPYKPFTLDSARATLTSRGHESMTGVVSDEREIAASDWAWARCTTWADRVPDPTQICLKDGFDGSRLYEVVFTARDPYVLGVGFAAFRDVESFFKFEAADVAGTANP